jgi:NAD(P)-dependent dehydrogenase (short-subunit alcohol dehydrogenase family)
MKEVPVELAGRRALVTGANRGLGEQFVAALLLDDPHAVMTELVSALGSDTPR